MSGILYGQRNALMWNGRPTNLYSRWRQWNRLGLCARILLDLAAEGQDTKTLKADATHLKAHRTGASLRGQREAGSTANNTLSLSRTH